MRTLAVMCAAWLCLAPVTGASDIFVNNMTGDDHFDGSRPGEVTDTSGPVLTISKALRLARAGDRIVVANTALPYRETLSLTGSKHSGSLVSPFVIEGNGATLDGSSPVPEDSWSHHVGEVFCFQPERLGHQQLLLAGQAALRHPTAPDAVTLPALEPLEWCLWAGKIYFCVDVGQMPDAYRTACCHLQIGITLYHVQDVVIRNLTVQGFQIDGVAAADAARSIRFDRLTCRANGRSGISVEGASTAELNGCKLVDNGEGQLRNEGSARTHVYGCEVIANTSEAFVRRGGTVTFDGKLPSPEEP